MSRSMKSRILIATLLAAVVGCAKQTPPAAPAPGPAPQPVPASRFTAADVQFMSGMIGHHAQAIEMSELAPTHGASARVQTLAARIINAQKDEIAWMQQWLRDRGQPVPDPAAHSGHAMHMPMPGMLTPEQMQQLADARGEKFDELYLKFMIQHHQGAVTMVKELFLSEGAAQDDATFKLASDVNVDQTTEIARMQSLLYELLIGKEEP